MANQIIELCGKNPPLERHDDGTLYSMNPDQMRRAKKLIVKQCCNYDNGNCLALDNGETCVCLQLIAGTVCCRWFRFAVLPLDRELEADIYTDRSSRKQCVECGQLFSTNYRQQKYCPDCAKAVHRRQKAESARKRRST